MALNDSLAWYYSLDEDSGQRNDSVGTNHLTDNSTVASAAGKVGTAADFESGQSESLSIASNATMQMGDIDFTLACWVYHESTGGAQSYISKAGTSTGTTWEYNLRANAGVVQFYVANGSSTAFVAGTTFSTATWYFVVGIHDAVNNELRLYVNAGSPSTQAIAIAPMASNGVFRLGARATPSDHYYDGLMDEAAGWKRALSSGEITELYNSGNGRDYAYVSSGGGGIIQHSAPIIGVHGIHSTLFGGQLVR
jgi:hypothetical protein